MTLPGPKMKNVMSRCGLVVDPGGIIDGSDAWGQDSAIM